MTLPIELEPKESFAGTENFYSCHRVAFQLHANASKMIFFLKVIQLTLFDKIKKNYRCFHKTVPKFTASWLLVDVSERRNR